MAAKNTRRDRQIMVRVDDDTHARWQVQADAHHEGVLASFVRITVNASIDAKEDK